MANQKDRENFLLLAQDVRETIKSFGEWNISDDTLPQDVFYTALQAMENIEQRIHITLGIEETIEELGGVEIETDKELNDY